MSLQSNSLVVSLSVSQWGGRKLDRKVTDEINTSHNASADAGRYNKLLVAKEHTEAVNKVAGRARAFHYDNTLPWGDNNERLLPTTNYFDYINQMNTLKDEFDQAVRGFLSNYDRVIDEAKVRLNGMFRDSDYPSRNEIEYKFGFRTTFLPVPSTDIRVSLNDAEVDALRKNIELEVCSRLSGAVQDIWARVKDQLTHMRNKLADKDGIFRDSLFDNLKELVDLLPKLNVTGDANIAQACNDMKVLMISPDAVRTNVVIRAEKAAEADAILSKFGGFFN